MDSYLPVSLSYKNFICKFKILLFYNDNWSSQNLIGWSFSSSPVIGQLANRKYSCIPRDCHGCQLIFLLSMSTKIRYLVLPFSLLSKIVDNFFSWLYYYNYMYIYVFWNFLNVLTVLHSHTRGTPVGVSISCVQYGPMPHP